MPELPDVEGFKRYLNRHAAGQRIEAVEVPDRTMLRSGTTKNLAGQELGRARRHGKWLLAPAGGNATILMHFGMTGHLRWTSGEPPHRHDRFVLKLTGGELRYRNMRRFGDVHVARGKKGVEALTKDLGPDALDVTREQWHGLLSTHAAP